MVVTQLWIRDRKVGLRDLRRIQREGRRVMLRNTRPALEQRKAANPGRIPFNLARYQLDRRVHMPFRQMLLPFFSQNDLLSVAYEPEFRSSDGKYLSDAKWLQFQWHR